jgi:hypothetical protein
MFTAIRRASSRIIRCAAERRPRLVLEIHISQRMPVRVADDAAELGGRVIDRPGRREATGLGRAHGRDGSAGPRPVEGPALGQKRPLARFFDAALQAPAGGWEFHDDYDAGVFR